MGYLSVLGNHDFREARLIKTAAVSIKARTLLIFQ